MNVFCPNDINIYDLSGGKKLPDFLSERKRRDLLRKGKFLVSYISKYQFQKFQMSLYEKEST